MTSVRYRNAVLDDAASVAGLFSTVFVETFGHQYCRVDLDSFLAGVTAEAFAEEIGNPAFALRVAEMKGRAIGFSKLGPPSLPVETPPGTLELWQIYVLKPWQGQGVAQQLYDWAEVEARGRGAEHMQLSVYVDNYPAKRFYERRGFADVGRYAFMVGSHEDKDIVMRKKL